MKVKRLAKDTAVVMTSVDGTKETVPIMKIPEWAAKEKEKQINLGVFGKRKLGEYYPMKDKE